MVEIVPRHPCCASGDYESVEFFADEKKRSVGPDTSWGQLTTVDGAPDPAGRGEAEIGGGLSGGQIRRLRTRHTQAIPVIGNSCVGLDRSLAHMGSLQASTFSRTLAPMPNDLLHV